MKIDRFTKVSASSPHKEGRIKNMRKSNNNEIRNIQRSGGTYYVTLPIEIIRKFKWKERQKVTVRVAKRGKTIEIKDWKK